ncbi:ABC transporter permease [Protaetiibacter sp. SSC-01]|uniref:ABC transporter permease n=1 Tax=Protaetiibacter sp. SSC-01 TaxID=2759943 RepID=UPI001656AC0B|nr:ABC transporter permease [Protaetiibacter sp. SSC-01]QNO37994.1 ABC transporter permease [Protaetiibacter sp. SSC-01]
MSPTASAILRTGVRRGVVEFRNMLQTPSEVIYYVVGIIGLVIALVVLRETTLDDSGFPLVRFLLPGLIAMQVLIAACFGPATVLATEREDGTLLRHKSLPHGMRGYLTGLTVRAALETVIALAIVLVPATFLVDGLWERGPIVLLGVPIVLLGLLAFLPLGFMVGSVFHNPRAVGGWGFVSIMIIAIGSGLFFPLAALPTWVQIIVVALPVYWFGHALRSVILPADAAVLEVGEAWFPPISLGVLAVWAAVGLVLAPAMLRRSARRESASAIERRRQAALQRV